MQLHEVEEIRACLPKGRTIFTYGKDWYAIELLKLSLQSETTVAELRRSSFGRLMNKDRVREWFGTLGKSTISPADLAFLWPTETESYRLTLDSFDGWSQTSRQGKNAWNLVLQMNLNGDDARLMDKHIEARDCDPFEWTCHPIHRGRNRTLAWARIDIDWRSGEALIEEIQNDRLREVKDLLDYAKSRKLQRVKSCGVELSTDFLVDYWDRRLRISRAVWAEAMVCATLQLIVRELGIRRIWYHTPESGRVYKNITSREPPRSVYTDLPRKFCFEKTEERPSFLRKRGGPAKRVEFQMLEL